ncbi:MAG: hypothetical protein JNM21_03565 [Taibaiella sp.]|nr:hypothetical protein [Taibaiella sp.]
MSRDNFTKPTIKKLAERAHYICSNPECKKMTVGPHADPNKSTITGIAAHICGAKDGVKSPRYDKDQTSDERKGINNGIWLCHDCSDMVDKDEKCYPATLLRQWKKTHEEFIKTLQTKGFASTLELLKPTTIEIDLSKQLINFFDDRRVLYDLFEQEIPLHGLRSVLAIRTELTNIKKQLGQATSLYIKVDQMLAACRKFHSELNDIDLDHLRYNNSDPDWIKFVTTLSELRKVFGIHILELSNKYKIQIGTDLQQILPTIT